MTGRRFAPLSLVLALTGLFAPVDGFVVTRPAVAVPFDGRPKILLHLAGTTSKNACADGQLSDCTAAAVAGELAGTVGPFYFAYVLAARGDMENVAGIEFGIRYQTGCVSGQTDGNRIDVLGWTHCGALEFPTDSPYPWPAPGSGNLITWSPTTNCQAGETAVAGYFYVGCYETADTLQVIPRWVSGQSKLALCTSIERTLSLSDLGSAAFGAGGSLPGCNPCAGPCALPPTHRSCGPDLVPPAAISNLAPVSIAAHSVRLGWTCTGDDGQIGRATSYDLRRDTSPITEASFVSATPVIGLPAPFNPGQHQEFDVTGLNASTRYYFAIKVRDEVINESGISNVVDVTLPAQSDFSAPDPVTDLAAVIATSNGVRLGWTATGDDGSIGTATLYDIRYSTAPITAANFAAATAASGEPAPQPAGMHQEFTVSGLGLNAIYIYYFAMKVVDDEDNVSALSNVVARRMRDNFEARILLHTRFVSVKNPCAGGQLADCATAAVNYGALYPTLHFVYLLVGRYGEVGSLQCGITYDLGAADGDDNHRGIDIYGWSLCATSESPSGSPSAWPKPGSGNLITWDSASQCQNGTTTAVAGYFYVGAYNPDLLQVTPRPSDGLARIFDCDGVPTTLPAAALGSAGFARFGSNPCQGEPPGLGVERTSWSQIKTLVRN